MRPIKFILLLILVMYSALTVSAQADRKWSLQAGLGEINMLENRSDDGDLFVSEDQGNAFYLSADYWLSQRFALNGGLTLEQQGLYTDYADGIGLKTFNLMGVNAGVKFYFFPKKWVLQPHVGATVHTNVLNLSHQKGRSMVTVKEGHPGSHGTLSYDMQCPALSLSPKIGVDLHLLSSLSLCVEYDYRIGLWGSSKAQFRFTDSPLIGQTVGIDERNIRSCISIGLKMDFPVKPVSEKAINNLFMLLHSWLSSR